MLSVNRRNIAGRAYEKGIPTGIDYRRSIIDYMESNGARLGEYSLPRGLRKTASQKFKVCPATITSFWTQYCNEGCVKVPVQTNRGRKKKLLEEDVEYVRFLKHVRPSMPLTTVRDELLKNSNSIETLGLSTISRTLKEDLNMTYKRISKINKNRFTPQNMNYTQHYINHINQKDPFTLKFMDEMGIKLADGQNNYGHSVKGLPCIELTRYNPHANGTVNAIVGMSGVKYVKIFDGPSNGTEYVQFIAEATQSFTDEGEPVFHPRDVLIADNAAIHHNRAERELRNFLPTVGVEYFFLPT